MADVENTGTNTVDVEKIMEEIREEAKAKPAYEPKAIFADGATVVGQGGNGAKKVMKKIAGKIIRFFVAMGLFVKFQLTNSKNLIVDNAIKTDDLSEYVYGNLETRLSALEQENQTLRGELEALRNQTRPRGQ